MDSNVFKFWLEGIALPVVGCIGVTGGEMLGIIKNWHEHNI